MGAALVIVVVVVPAFAQRDQCHKEVVPAGVGGRIAPPSPSVTDRVHHEGRVVRQYAADEEAPDQAGPTTEKEAQPGQGEGGSQWYWSSQRSSE